MYYDVGDESHVPLPQPDILSNESFNPPEYAFHSGDWHLAHFTWDGANVKLYLDGALQDTVPYVGSILGTGAGDAFYVGRSNSAGPTFLRGTVDETRVQDTARSAQWIWAEYLSMQDRFLAFSTVQSESAFPEPGSSSPTYLSTIGEFAREPTVLVKITLPGTITGSQTFYFSFREGRPLSAQIGKDIRPYLTEYKGRTTKLSPERSVTERSRVTLTFSEDENPPDFDSAVFTVYTGGSFWRRFVVSQPDYVGSTIEILRGFTTDNFHEADFETIFYGRVEEINFDATRVTLVAKDAMTFVDRKAPAAIADTNLINGALLTTSSTINVDTGNQITNPTTMASKDYMPVIIRINPKSIPVLATNLSWTAATHKLTQVSKFAGYTYLRGDYVRLKHASITEDDYEIVSKVSDDSVILRESIYDGDIANGIEILPKEDISIASIATNALTVQANYLGKSEDFTDVVWGKTSCTITANQSVGPWGGLIADLLTFTAATGNMNQLSGFDCASTNWTFSIWMRASSSGNTGKIHITVSSSDTVYSQTVECTLTTAWTRYEVSLLLNTTGPTVNLSVSRQAGDVSSLYVWGAQLEKAVTTRGFYTPTNKGSTSPIPGAYAGRGLFGTNTSAHYDDSIFKEVINYCHPLSTASGLHPIFIIRDLINRGGVPVAQVDETTFAREFSFIESMEFKRAGSTSISDSQTLSEIIEEVREQALLDLWVSEKGLFKVVFSFRTTLPGGNSYEFSDESHFVFRTIAVQANRESRTTRVFVYYDPYQGEPGDEPNQFRHVQVVLDLTAETNPGPAAKAIFSKWIFRSSEALSLAGRIISRYKRAARIAKFDLDIKDDPNVNVGEFFYMNTSDILAKLSTAATRSATSWQAVQKTEKRKEGRINVEALEARGLKYCVIGPNSLPADYDDATASERQYCWIGTAQNLVGNFQDDGYYIL